MNNLEFKFTGGDADNNQINFYDGSRFLYGAARFIHHIDYFRNTGNVTERIYKKHSNFVINAPQQGSFLIDIIQISAPILAEYAIKVPIDVMFSYFWNSIINRTTENDVAIEKEKTTQKALEVIDNQNNRFAEFANNALEKVAEQQNQNEEIRQKELEDTSKNREAILLEYKSELSKISLENINKISTKLRPAIVEMGRPTFASAEKLVINSNSKPLAVLDKFTIEKIKGNIVDLSPISLLGKVIQFNTVTGWGKFQADKSYSFLVPAKRKQEWTEKIVNAMNFEKEKYFLFYCVKDSVSNIIHLIFDTILVDIENGR